MKTTPDEDLPDDELLDRLGDVLDKADGGKADG